MIPHERSLVEKWKGRPFALIGVNSDEHDTPEQQAGFKKQLQDNGVTWRSFRNDSIAPPIADTWRVQGWPTLYYIDHEGIIRHKDIREEAEMEHALEEMITAAEKATKK
ncbi:MAG: hypothetical protein IPK26_21485 [Planctomycetes bacterium]|nr:hypothetical protein [Planctomycetota bacterium]